MNKKVIYTCITNGYDTLKDPTVVTEGYDYVCFTDDADMKSDIWQFRPLPKEVDEIPSNKKQRFIKINPHLFLKEYDFSIWIDGNVTIRGNLDHFINYVMEHKESFLKSKCSVFVPKHPWRDCIYKEAAIVKEMLKDSSAVEKQIAKYEAEGFPKKYGLLQSNILLRKHNDPQCIKLMESWSNEVMNFSHRDQLSFNYVLWKSKDIEIKYIDENIYISEWFHWNGRHFKKKKNE